MVTVFHVLPKTNLQVQMANQLVLSPKQAVQLVLLVVGMLLWLH
jgi:hypothetical protein